MSIDKKPPRVWNETGLAPRDLGEVAIEVNHYDDRPIYLELVGFDVVGEPGAVVSLDLADAKALAATLSSMVAALEGAGRAKRDGE